MSILDRLFELQDKEYAVFQSNLTPGFDTDSIIGVRVPKVRELAKEVIMTAEGEEFLRALPHKYYDENMLHGLMISGIKDYGECVKAIDTFLPYVDNWAVCDTISPKIFKKHKSEVISKIKEWTSSKEVYTCRFGIRMLMNFFLDEDFNEEYLEIPASVHSDEYYVKMMVAWFYATALAKQWDATLPYISDRRLDVWVHNKSIQKARESYRITAEQKELLNDMKIRKA